METLVIDAKNFISGVSLNDWTSNGGYSPLTKGINPGWDEKGILYPQPIGTRITDNGGFKSPYNQLISVDRDPATGDSFVVDAGGHVYRMTTGLLTLLATETTQTYQIGTTDCKYFKSAFFVTSREDITMLTGGSLGTVDPVWWSTTLGKGILDSSYRHPIEVVEDTMYVADKWYINTWDGTTGVQGAVVLPNKVNITAMIKHPNGRDLLVFAVDAANYGGVKAVRSYMYTINTLTLAWTKETLIDDQVHGAINVGGIVYAAYGRNLGYVTDTGLSFLRELDLGGQPTSGSIDFKHKLAQANGHLLVCERNAVLAYGDLGAGKQFWYPIKKPDDVADPNTRNISIVIPLADRTIAYSHLTQYADTGGGVRYPFPIFSLDFLNNAQTFDPTLFVGNRTTFAQRAWVRRIDLEHTKLDSGTPTLYIGYYDELGVLHEELYTLDNTTGRTRITVNINTSMYQPTIRWASTYVGIKKFTAYYEPAE